MKKIIPGGVMEISKAGREGKKERETEREVKINKRKRQRNDMESYRRK